jgi:hypothetical protein
MVVEHLWSAPDATCFVSPHCDLHAVSGIELAHEAGKVSLDGADADVHVVGDLVVGPALSHWDQDLFLPAGERLDRLTWWLSGTRGGEGSEKPCGDTRGDEGVALGGGMDRPSKQLGPGIFEQEATGASLQGSMHVLVEVEGGDHDDDQRVVHLWAGQLPGSLDTVHLGHAYVEQAHVRAELTRECHRFAAIDSLADDLDVRLSVENHREPGTHDPSLMVFCALILRPRVNRIASIALGTLYALTVIAGAIGEWSYYILGSAIEVALLAAIVYYAWTWPKEYSRASMPDEGHSVTTPARQRSPLGPVEEL